MPDSYLERLCDLATEAHTRLQQDFQHIDPVVGVSQNMRDSGVPADVMTIECLKTRRLIILILHDHQPDTLHYQFSSRDKDPGGAFEQIPTDELSVQLLYDWMAEYFSSD